MSREEIRDTLMEAIITCRATARAATRTDLSAADKKAAHAEDDAALQGVWELIRLLG